MKNQYPLHELSRKSLRSALSVAGYETYAVDAIVRAVSGFEALEAENVRLRNIRDELLESLKSAHQMILNMMILNMGFHRPKRAKAEGK